MDNMFEESERASPLPRPPSRSGGVAKGIQRPSSRSGVHSSRTGVARKISASTLPVHAKRISRSAQPSPAHRSVPEAYVSLHSECCVYICSRETSPTGTGHYGSRKVVPLTADSLKKLYVSVIVSLLCMCQSRVCDCSGQ